MQPQQVSNLEIVKIAIQLAIRLRKSSDIGVDHTLTPQDAADLSVILAHLADTLRTPVL